MSKDLVELDRMYQESRREQLEKQGIVASKEQDEDINTDEELLRNNKKVMLTDLRHSVNQFATLGKKKQTNVS